MRRTGGGVEEDSVGGKVGGAWQSKGKSKKKKSINIKIDIY